MKNDYLLLKKLFKIASNQQKIIKKLAESTPEEIGEVLVEERGGDPFEEEYQPYGAAMPESGMREVQTPFTGSKKPPKEPTQTYEQMMAQKKVEDYAYNSNLSPRETQKLISSLREVINGDVYMVINHPKYGRMVIWDDGAVTRTHDGLKYLKFKYFTDLISGKPERQYELDIGGDYSKEYWEALFNFLLKYKTPERLPGIGLADVL